MRFTIDFMSRWIGQREEIWMIPGWPRLIRELSSISSILKNETEYIKIQYNKLALCSFCTILFTFSTLSAGARSQWLNASISCGRISLPLILQMYSYGSSRIYHNHTPIFNKDMKLPCQSLQYHLDVESLILSCPSDISLSAQCQMKTNNDDESNMPRSSEISRFPERTWNALQQSHSDLGSTGIRSAGKPFFAIVGT